MDNTIPKAKLSRLAEKIAYHERQLTELRLTYDREFAQDVRMNDRLNAGLTIPQIMILVSMTEGTLRNRMSARALRDKVVRIDGKAGLLYADVKAHLMAKRRGRISEDRVKVILKLRDTTDMTQEQIAETLNMSRRTIQRVLERDATNTTTEE
jgi:DNA-binding transcriptional regulator YiaG